MDVKNINIPDFSKCIESKEYYIYSEFLKPGRHEILIYDPKYNRAYCKDFIVNINMREDIYPEFPCNSNNVIKKPIGNVWR